MLINSDTRLPRLPRYPDLSRTIVAPVVLGTLLPRSLSEPVFRRVCLPEPPIYFLDEEDDEESDDNDTQSKSDEDGYEGDNEAHLCAHPTSNTPRGLALGRHLKAGPLKEAFALGKLCISEEVQVQDEDEDEDDANDRTLVSGDNSPWFGSIAQAARHQSFTLQTMDNGNKVFLKEAFNPNPFNCGNTGSVIIPTRTPDTRGFHSTQPDPVISPRVAVYFGHSLPRSLSEPAFKPIHTLRRFQLRRGYMTEGDSDSKQQKDSDSDSDADTNADDEGDSVMVSGDNSPWFRPTARTTCHESLTLQTTDNDHDVFLKEAFSQLIDASDSGNTFPMGGDRDPTQNIGEPFSSISGP